MISIDMFSWISDLQNIFKSLFEGEIRPIKMLSDAEENCTLFASLAISIRVTANEKDKYCTIKWHWFAGEDEKTVRLMDAER